MTVRIPQGASQTQIDNATAEAAATRFSFGGQTTGETGPRWEASDEC